ncbi:DUF3159 domain-containing protein [Corynebacterium jeikeium]|uniref:DUF3159 domain-containing protein n=1 Tax=Corynebacterium jeikeium TaxID=38289 RepID=UPI00088FC7AD|nr:DUF3159 domain-containing protein [Corynebacterium jeikeium]SCX15960.1 hypothetical protein CJBVI_1125 [Corynebacterium jeikeium]
MADTAANSTDAESKETLLEQMGGLSGLVSSTLPVLVLVPVNSKWGLGPALISALAVAVLILVWRLARKENLQPAISGFLAVALCAAIAWIMGDAKGYFAYGIWYSLAAGIASIISIFVRWPLVGAVWRGINGDDHRWRTNRRAVRAFNIATLAWALVFFARFAVQQWLYAADKTDALGYTRIAMGWPLTLVAVAVTVWAVKAANHAEGRHLDKSEEDAQEPNDTQAPGDPEGPEVLEAGSAEGNNDEVGTDGRQ